MSEPQKMKLQCRTCKNTERFRFENCTVEGHEKYLTVVECQVCGHVANMPCNKCFPKPIKPGETVVVIAYNGP